MVSVTDPLLGYQSTHKDSQRGSEAASLLAADKRTQRGLDTCGDAGHVAG